MLIHHHTNNINRIWFRPNINEIFICYIFGNLKKAVKRSKTKLFQINPSLCTFPSDFIHRSTMPTVTVVYVFTIFQPFLFLFYIVIQIYYSELAKFHPSFNHISFTDCTMLRLFPLPFQVLPRSLPRTCSHHIVISRVSPSFRSRQFRSRFPR